MHSPFIHPGKAKFPACYPLIIAACFILFLVSCKTAKPSAATSLSMQLDTVFARVKDFSGVVLVADKGKPMYEHAFGFLKFETHEPMTASAIFELASVSKQFTAMTIMVLVDEGKLRFDDPVDQHIPGLPYPGVTIRHLLNHTSGLPDYQELMDKYWDKTKIAGNPDNIAYLIQYHPPALFEPGAKYQYSNTGYMLLASITERVSGQDFIAFCRERFFTPYGMTDTDIRTREEKSKLKNLATGHIYVAEKQSYIPADSFPQFNYAIWLGDRKGPGRVSSTTADLLKWDRALYTGKIVSQETLWEAFSPARLHDGTLSQYGFGWKLEEHPTLGKVVRHDGDNPGYKTEFVRYIEADKTIIVLCNNNDGTLAQIIRKIEELLLTEQIQSGWK